MYNQESDEEVLYMMDVNYHSHTARCGHADGTEREYVEAALQKGFRVFGFSDHTPQPYPEEKQVSRMRMKMKELPDYCRTVLDLKEEYKDRFRIHLGLEVEYMPKYFDELCRAADANGVEYMILGQHFVTDAGEHSDEFTGFYAGIPTPDPAVIRAYVDSACAAMVTGRIVYFAHPDLIRFVGDPAVYDSEMRRLCEAALKNHVPLEINMLGVMEHRHYPTEAFWKIVGETGNDVIWGLDAHHVSSIGRPEVLADTQALTERYHLHRITHLPMDGDLFK
ncbi:MAG: histidinol-phosphatase [Firmicutes bacterium]|nr:histidinol-phosphatase [Bacillota bacterium]